MEVNKNKRYAVLIVLITNAILIGFLESFIPIPIPVPGVKLGLANIITMMAIAFLSFKEVLFIVIVRCVVVALLTRGVLMLAFSLSGGIMSALVMWVIYHKFSRLFSIKGMSVSGAIVHSMTQLAVAAFILNQTVVLYYLPVLLISSVITGLITGTIAELAIAEVRKKGVLEGITGAAKTETDEAQPQEAQSAQAVQGVKKEFAHEASGKRSS